MLSKEEIESMKIGLWNIRADILKAMQCSLADTSDKKEWQKEINTIDNALEYIDQLESDKQKLIEKLEIDNEFEKVNVQELEMMRRKTSSEHDKTSYQKKIHVLNARRELRKEILSIVKGEKE